MNDKVEKTTIGINSDTRKRLVSYGGFQDSYDDVINRVLDELEELKKEN